MRLFKKSAKQTQAVAFVDYEHWFYGYKNMYYMQPNIEEWLAEIREEYQCSTVYIFGDFSEYPMNKEVEKLEKLDVKLIHTANSTEHAKKDFTDFIMLDSIYQSAARKDSPDKYIIFTGDGHFDSVMKYLKNVLGKKVIVYGVKRGFSSKLKSIATSYVEMPRQAQEQNFYYNLILKSLSYLDKRGKKATYWKTIHYVAENSNVMEKRVETAMQELIKNHYVVEVELDFKGRKSKVLEVYWERLREDSLWLDA